MLQLTPTEHKKVVKSIGHDFYVRHHCCCSNVSLFPPVSMLFFSGLLWLIVFATVGTNEANMTRFQIGLCMFLPAFTLCDIIVLCKCVFVLIVSKYWVDKLKQNSFDNLFK